MAIVGVLIRPQPERPYRPARLIGRARSRWCLIALSLLALPLSACTSHSPNCDRAADYLHKGNLSQAADLYAKAQRLKEGSCGADGLDQITKLQASSLAATAKGHAAESAADLQAAQAAYESALAIDQGNAEAAAGLRRVTRRPTIINPIWFTAQRLHDEGYDQDARTEVANVLRQHPDETVPESLAHLSVPTTVAPTATGHASAKSAASSGSGAVVGLLLSLLGVLVVAAGLLGWLGSRWIRSTAERTASTVDHLRNRAEKLESELRASRLAINAVHTEIDDVRGKIADARAHTSRWSTATGDRIDELVQRADRLSQVAGDLETAGRGRQREIRQIFLALTALREREPVLVVEHYEQTGATGREAT
jgi:hypothetical protein